MQPTLSWPGRDASSSPALAPGPVLQRHPGQPPLPEAAPNRLHLGDNLAVMRSLQAALEGRIDLLYADPPFGSDDNYVLRRGGTETFAYGDRWPGGPSGYLGMLLPRLVAMHALLAPQGSLYLHLDSGAVHYAKVLCDEIFGRECFQREIIWRIGWVSGYKSAARNWIRNHDTILFYTKDPRRFTFHKPRLPHPPGYARRGGGEGRGRPVEDVWNANAAEAALTGPASLDSIQLKSFSREKTGWATQKNESLLRRIIAASSSPGDLVADFFCGSGTTLVAAEGLGRRWLGCDVSEAAIALSRERLFALPQCHPFEIVGPPGPGQTAPEKEPAACSTADSAAPASR